VLQDSPGERAGRSVQPCCSNISLQQRLSRSRPCKWLDVHLLRAHRAVQVKADGSNDMASGEGRLDPGSWNGLLQGAAMPFMPGFFGGAGGPPDAAALAAAYVQLQQQHPQFMGQNMQARRFGGGNRTAYPPDRSGVKKCGHCQVRTPGKTFLPTNTCKPHACGAASRACLAGSDLPCCCPFICDVQTMQSPVPQSMKPCMEFSADTSRGDGLRGWCKLCEAEARSTRYKKRKAAAQAAASARRKCDRLALFGCQCLLSAETQARVKQILSWDTHHLKPAISLSLAPVLRSDLATAGSRCR